MQRCRVVHLVIYTDYQNNIMNDVALEADAIIEGTCSGLETCCKTGARPYVMHQVRAEQSSGRGAKPTQVPTAES
jgi:hypothetical protein